MKRLLMVMALTLLPTAAMAQQHQEHAKKETAKAAEHVNFARELIAAKAELKLTAEQITKLEAFSVKMDEHHKMMGEHQKMAGDHKKMAGEHKQMAGQHAEHAKAEAADAAKMEGKMHADLLSVFTEEQLVKVRPMMKAHMDKCEHMQAAKKKTGEHKH